MEEKLNKIVKESRELLLKVSDQDNSKRKILLNRAEKAIDTFEVVMSKLLQ